MPRNPFTKLSGLEKLTNFGNSLLKEFLHPGEGFGAHSAVIYGPIGTGKTSLLLSLALYFSKNGWYTIVRGREVLEVVRLPNWSEIVEILVPEHHSVKFVEQSEEGRRELNLPYKRYTNTKDLIKKIHKGKISVVFPPKKIEPIPAWIKERIPYDDLNSSWELIFWTDLFNTAIRRLAGRKTALFIDEAHELWAPGTSGAYWHLIELSKNKIADFRKSTISLTISTHQPQDLDWRIPSKCDFRFYLRGTRVPRGSLVKRTIVMTMPKGQAYIEHNNFGVITFKFLSNPGSLIFVELKRRGRMKTEYKVKKQFEVHKKAIFQVAKENGGYIKRKWVENKLSEKFDRVIFYEVIRELKKQKLLEATEKRGVYRVKVV